jgi:hypothetical protein
MKYKAKYSAESEIPADVKAFYILQGGEWVFNGAEFDGLDALLNPGLAANRDAIKAEKKTEHDARVAIEKERDDANVLLAKASKPGTVHMDAADQKLLDEYKEIGPIKDIKEKLDNEKQVVEKLTLLSTEKDVRQLAKDLGLNEDALVDFKLNSERGKNVILASVKQKVKDAKGVETEKLIPVVQVTDTVNGKEVVTNKNFAEFAKENHYPEYLVQAIFNGSAASLDKTDKTKTFRAPPSLSEKTVDDESGSKTSAKKVVDRFNQERSTRKLPWSTPAEKTE